mmetsp:Transcript_52291/g.60031  ORF Transcript_52291/g.60031 Transcript_52291/m.60031 type:complete len:271 (+) Transcript_52291:838-1650(+)
MSNEFLRHCGRLGAKSRSTVLCHDSGFARSVHRVRLGNPFNIRLTVLDGLKERKPLETEALNVPCMNRASACHERGKCLLGGNNYWQITLNGANHQTQHGVLESSWALELHGLRALLELPGSRDSSALHFCRVDSRQSTELKIRDDNRRIKLLTTLHEVIKIEVSQTLTVLHDERVTHRRNLFTGLIRTAPTSFAATPVVSSATASSREIVVLARLHRPAALGTERGHRRSDCCLVAQLLQRPLIKNNIIPPVISRVQRRPTVRCTIESR